MKTGIAIVDGNPTHRRMLAETLATAYAVQVHDAPAHAFAGLLADPPKLILVGQQVGGGSGAGFIKDLRREGGLSEIPVILIVDSEDFRILDTMREYGIKDYLVKPYRRSAIFDLISRHLNGHVERSWQDLPVAQRKALEGTLGIFNTVADMIASGNPLPMQEINESCAALVEVVGKEELGSLLGKIKDHDNLTYVHSLRFSTLMALFGKSIGLPKPQQIMVATGGLIHDMGMMTIPRDSLIKQGKLTPNEFIVVRNHVAVSQKILGATEAIPRGISMIVTQDHERLDGSGYPRGLKAGELNDLARMAGIIDVFCALTDRRPYRRTLPAHIALETMATEMKLQLDQDMLYKFKEILLDTAATGEIAA